MCIEIISLLGISVRILVWGAADRVQYPVNIRSAWLNFFIGVKISAGL